MDTLKITIVPVSAMNFTAIDIQFNDTPYLFLTTPNMGRDSASYIALVDDVCGQSVCTCPVDAFDIVHKIFCRTYTNQPSIQLIKSSKTWTLCCQWGDITFFESHPLAQLLSNEYPRHERVNIEPDYNPFSFASMVYGFVSGWMEV